MALKRRLLAGLMLLLVMIAIAILPPRTCDVTNESGSLAWIACGPPEWVYDVHWHSVEQARQRLALAVRDRELADSVRGSPRAVRSADGSITVIYDGHLSADSARVFLRLAAAERDVLPGTGTRGRIVVVLRSDSTRWARLSFVARNQAEQSDPPARVFSRDSTCFVSLNLARNRRLIAYLGATDSSGVRRGAFLGYCALAGRFGVPGPHTLRGVAWAMNAEGQWPPLSAAVVMRNAGAPWEREQSPSTYSTVGCMESGGVACLVHLGLGSGVDRSRPFDWGMAREVRSLLGYLMAKNGPEAFGRFWRSPLPFDGALQAGFGRPASDLIQEWALWHYRAPEPKVTVRPPDLLAALGWLGAALAIAVAVGMRRQVDV